MAVTLLAGIFVFPVSGEETTITDGLGREVTVPLNPDSLICSGAGCLRYLTYLQAQDKIIAVDALDKFIFLKSGMIHAAGCYKDITPEMIHDVYSVQTAISVMHGYPVVVPLTG